MAPEASVKLVSLEKLRQLKHLEVSLGNHSILIVLVKDHAKAYNNACPHQGAPLSMGEFCDRSVTCPLHNWTFELESGRCIHNAKCALDPIEIDIQNGWVVTKEIRASE